MEISRGISWRTDLLRIEVKFLLCGTQIANGIDKGAIGCTLFTVPDVVYDTESGAMGC